MFTDIQAAGGRLRHPPSHREPNSPEESARAVQRKDVAPARAERGHRGHHDLALDFAVRRAAEEATTPCDQYFFAIALKAICLELSRGSQIIYDGIMPAGTLYVSAPSRHFSAQFHAPCDFRTSTCPPIAFHRNSRECAAHGR